METQVNGWGRRLGIFLISLHFLTPPPATWAQSLVHPWQNRTTSSQGLVFEPRIGFFSSRENFDASGSQTALTGTNEISWTQFEIHANYAVADSLYIFGRLTALSAGIRNLGNELQTFGLSDQLLGAAYRLYAKPHGLSISVQIDATLPAYNNNTLKQNSQPFLGDGSTDFTVGGFVEAPLPFGKSGEWFGEGGIGFRGRSSGFSSALPWSVLIKKEPEAKGLLFGAGLRGQASLNTDTTNPASALPDQLSGGAGSALINAINPSWTVAHAILGYKTRYGQSLYANVGLPISGANAASGIHIVLGAQFDFASPTRESRLDTAEPLQTQAPTQSVETRKKIRPRVRSQSEGFYSYNLDAEVISTQDQLYLLKLDKGRSDGVEKGQYFDIFKRSEDAVTGTGSETRIARAKVTAVKSSESVLTVVEYFVDQWVEVGFVAKRLVQ